MSRRIKTTVPKLKMLRKEFPQAMIGIIDALPPKGIPYAKPYKDLLEKSRLAGAPIQVIHVDAPYSSIDKTIGWENLSRLKKTISRDLELEFGIKLFISNLAPPVEMDIQTNISIFSSSTPFCI